MSSGIIGLANNNSSRTNYTKVNNGIAIGAYIINGTVPDYGSDWVSVFLLSTIQEYALMRLQTEFGWRTPVLKTFTYLDLQWYSYAFGQNRIFGGGTYIDTPFPTVDLEGKISGYPSWNSTPPDETYIYILQQAGVHLI